MYTSYPILRQSAPFPDSHLPYTPANPNHTSLGDLTQTKAPIPDLPGSPTHEEELFQSYNQDCDSPKGLRKKYDLGTDLPERLLMVSSSSAANSVLGKIVEEEISWRVIGEIPVKGWLMLSLFGTSVSCLWMVLALFPAILQFKYGFSVGDVGVIMARLPLIEAFSKFVGVLYAMNYGKRGFTIMVTSMISSIVFLAMILVPKDAKGMIEILLGLIGVPIGIYFSI
jgi:hypothetical protein